MTTAAEINSKARFDRACKRKDITLAYLREMAVLFVEDEPGLDLGKLLLHMQTISRDDPLISRALSGLMNRKVLYQGADHRVYVLSTED